MVLGNFQQKSLEKIFDAFERQVDIVRQNFADSPERLMMIFDEGRQTFPFFVVLLLFRAGMEQEAFEYCRNSQVPEVRIFGESLLASYLSNKGVPDRNEVVNYQELISS